jgi:hypothetical protein
LNWVYKSNIICHLTHNLYQKAALRPDDYLTSSRNVSQLSSMQEMLAEYFKVMGGVEIAGL